MNHIARSEEVERIRAGLADWPVTVLLGPRQCGKTTLVKPFATSPDHYFDLHDFVDQVRLEDSNYRVLDGLDGTVVIDEAQERPALFQKMRVLADRKNRTTRFILTGSASPSLYQGTSESLAGRARLLSLSGFSLSEIDPEHWERLWLRGGYPLSYLREIEENSMEWRQNYIAQFLGRDLPALAETKLTIEQLRRFFLLLAHHHGQYWNHSEIATTLGVNYKTIQRHVDIFKGAYLLRELPPFHTNAKKRLRKAPKIYLRDSGLLHTLLGIRNLSQLYASPQLGASWEGFGIEQVISLLKTREEGCFTWSVQGGAEVDLVLNISDKPFGFEFKAADAPRRTRSMTSAIESLNLKKLFVVYPGEKNYNLDDSIAVVSIKNLRDLQKMCIE
jgi:predicted AAA+ superfamily ATPase